MTQNIDDASLRQVLEENGIMVNDYHLSYVKNTLDEVFFHIINNIKTRGSAKVTYTVTVNTKNEQGKHETFAVIRVPYLTGATFQEYFKMLEIDLGEWLVKEECLQDILQVPTSDQIREHLWKVSCLCLLKNGDLAIARIKSKKIQFVELSSPIEERTVNACNRFQDLSDYLKINPEFRVFHLLIPCNDRHGYKDLIERHRQERPLKGFPDQSYGWDAGYSTDYSAGGFDSGSSGGRGRRGSRI